MRDSKVRIVFSFYQKKNQKDEVVVVSNIHSSSTSSTSSSDFSSLSFASSTAETHPSVGGDKKKKKSLVRIKSRKFNDKLKYNNYGHFAIDVGFLLLVSLIVILVWGRVCAVLWTSSCLFLSYKRRPELMLVATSIDYTSCVNEEDDDEDRLMTSKSSSQELKTSKSGLEAEMEKIEVNSSKVEES